MAQCPAVFQLKHVDRYTELGLCTFILFTLCGALKCRISLPLTLKYTMEMGIVIDRKNKFI
jgi:hypothetical protein